METNVIYDGSFGTFLFYKGTKHGFFCWNGGEFWNIVILQWYKTKAQEIIQIKGIRNE